MRDVSADMSFLELFDVLNEQLNARGRGAGRVRPRLPRGHLRVVRHDDRRPGPRPRDRHRDLPAPPAQARRTARPSPSSRGGRPGFPIIKDLAVDRSAFDRIVEAGGYITAPTGSARDANEILVPKEAADAAMDAAACIGCGACVAACPNSAAQLFTSAKYSHLSLLPQGQPERFTRVVGMVEEMERCFGSCTNHGECEAACPKEISIDFIALLNRDYVKAQFKNRALAGQKS